MLKFQVVSPSAREIKYTDKKGAAASFFLQTVYAFTTDRDGNPAPFPEKLEIALERDESGRPKIYPAGEYNLHPSALYVDARGRLAVAPRLVPVKRTS